MPALLASRPSFYDLIDSGPYLRAFAYLSENWWLAIPASIAVLWITIYAVERRRRRLAEELLMPKTLWDQLCLAHGLTTEERQMLRRLAGTGELEACRVFVDPRRWRHAARQPADRLMLDTLQQRLYGPTAGELFGDR